MTGSPTPIPIAVTGAAGRLGSAVVEAIEARPDARLVAAIGRSGDGLDLALAAAAVIIDASAPEPAAALARRCAERGGPALVIGVTGFDTGQEAQIAAAAARIALIRSGNFSLGVNLLAALIRRAAATLGPDYDIEVFETHHRRKIDAPSGTAIMLGEAAAEGRGVRLAEVAAGLDGDRRGARREGSIGFAVSRAGGVVGEHEVSFAAEDEVLTLSHSARDRSLFARGAVEAAVWLAARPAGAYTMAQVLGLEPDQG